MPYFIFSNRHNHFYLFFRNDTMQPARRKTLREVPNQHFQRIKRNVLCKANQDGHISWNDLFTDISFPPDLSSLSYVYTGNDHYEKMTFRRPLVSIIKLYVPFPFSPCHIQKLEYVPRWIWKAFHKHGIHALESFYVHTYHTFFSFRSWQSLENVDIRF